MHKHKHTFHYDEDVRRKTLPPEKILEDNGLKPGNIFVDVGCNDGYFTIPAAHIVKVHGKVYGIDIAKEPLKTLEEKAKKIGLKNVFTKVAKAEDSVFLKNEADMIFYNSVLHDFIDPLLVLQNAYKMLKTEGMVLNIDWKINSVHQGPPPGKAISEEKAKDLFQKANFKNIEIQDYSEDFYLIKGWK